MIFFYCTLKEGANLDTQAHKNKILGSATHYKWVFFCSGKNGVDWLPRTHCEYCFGPSDPILNGIGFKPLIIPFGVLTLIYLV